MLLLTLQLIAIASADPKPMPDDIALLFDSLIIKLPFVSAKIDTQQT
jgi:hypothetical protein